jgi:glucose-1-phosphate thymidylyltransferase
MTGISGVVPAAGFATRLQPLAGSKELLRVGGRPVIDYLLERMSVGGAEEIRVVTRPEKADLVRHADACGAEVVFGRPATVAESLVLGLSSLERDRVVLIGFPDSVWDPVDGFRRLLPALDRADVVLGLFATPDPERSDVVEVDDEGRVVGIEVKPPRPRSNLIWGCVAGRAGPLAGLRGCDEPSDLFADLARARRVSGVRLGRFKDYGTPEALRQLAEAPS